jgi:hypothetical protein
VIERYSLIGLVFGLILILVDIFLLRKRKTPGKTFLIWFIVGISVCAVSLMPSLFSVLSIFFGAEYQISTVVAVGFSFFLLMFFYLNYKISELSSQLMKLAIQISVANYTRNPNEQSNRNTLLSTDPEPDRK